MALRARDFKILQRFLLCGLHIRIDDLIPNDTYRRERILQLERSKLLEWVDTLREGQPGKPPNIYRTSRLGQQLLKHWLQTDFGDSNS